VCLCMRVSERLRAYCNTKEVSVCVLVCDRE